MVRNKQRGFIQNLILPSLILMGVVVMGWGYILNAGGTAKQITTSVDTAREQLVQLNSVINWCRVMYPGADNGLAHHKNLPASPVDESWIPVRNAVCPGAPAAGTVWQAAKETLTMPGRFLAEWEYRNVPTGVFFRLSVETAGDTNGQAVLEQVARRLHASQQTLTGDTLEIRFSN